CSAGLVATFFLVMVGACGDNAASGTPDACVGLGCRVVDCAAMSKPRTTITGTVYAPNGTLPLNGITVYVPFSVPLPPFTEGVTCERCSDPIPNGSVALAVSNADGT